MKTWPKQQQLKIISAGIQLAAIKIKNVTHPRITFHFFQVFAFRVQAAAQHWGTWHIPFARFLGDLTELASPASPWVLPHPLLGPLDVFNVCAQQYVYGYIVQLGEEWVKASLRSSASLQRGAQGSADLCFDNSDRTWGSGEDVAGEGQAA